MIRNILLCTTQVPFTTGGAESHVANLQAALRAAGYRAETVALPFKWYPAEQIVRDILAWRLLDLSESNGVPVDLVIGLKFPAYAVEHPNKVLWIIHQHRAAYNLAGTRFDDLSPLAEGPRVRELIRRCDEQFIPAARKVFANSQAVAARLCRFNDIESETLYHPPPRADFLRSGEAGDYVFYPSRLEPQKRQEILIEAMQYVRTPVRAVFAGGSRDESHYRDLVKRYGVGERVELRGFVAEDELIDLYAGALAVCYLPFDEDYGYVTLEAMLSGRPVVVPADGGGAAEFVEHEVTGFVVEPDARAVAARLDELYSDRGRAPRRGARGRDKIISLDLSWERVVERLIDAASK
jgi:glycosyltransferase involved in cell wall biosynthesis